MRILVAEDDDSSRLMLKRILTGWDHEVVVTADGQAAWEALNADDAPRLALLDWMMPGLTGVEICQKLREQEQEQETYTYLILLTAKQSKENLVAGMEAGADDYISKPFDQHELRVRLRAGQRIIDLQSEVLAANKELKILSTTDSLTGVFNRRAVLEQVDVEMSRCRRIGAPLTISVVDLDYFKRVNDTYGHPTGDEVLRACTRQITANIRKYDSQGRLSHVLADDDGSGVKLGRLGGEEFLILLPGEQKDGAQVVSERIRKLVEEMTVTFDGKPVTVTISQGVAVWDNQSSVEELIAAADAALYRAKQNGRNRIEWA